MFTKVSLKPFDTLKRNDKKYLNLSKKTLSHAVSEGETACGNDRKSRHRRIKKQRRL